MASITKRKKWQLGLAGVLWRLLGLTVNAQAQIDSTRKIGFLDADHVQISMTETGDLPENPIAERVNGILKNEYLAHRAVCSLTQAELFLEQAVFLYNYKRPHLSCDLLVPDPVHQGLGKPQRRWKNYYFKKQVW